MKVTPSFHVWMLGPVLNKQSSCSLPVRKTGSSAYLGVTNVITIKLIYAWVNCEMFFNCIDHEHTLSTLLQCKKETNVPFRQHSSREFLPKTCGCSEHRTFPCFSQCELSPWTFANEKYLQPGNLAHPKRNLRIGHINAWSTLPSHSSLAVHRLWIGWQIITGLAL